MIGISSCKKTNLLVLSKVKKEFNETLVLLLKGVQYNR